MNQGEKILQDSKVEVVYIRDDAFLKCECNKDMALHRFSKNEYTGKCICGKEYKLKDKFLYGPLI